MNNVLFGVIGVLMLAITGVGMAEVGTQMRAESAALHAAEEPEGEVAGASSEVTDIPLPERAIYAVTDAVTAVVDTSTSVILGESDHDRDENEGDDEDEDDDEDDRAPTTSPAPTKTAPSVPGTPATVQTFTMAQVAAHNTAADCYSAINGSVYDLSSFVSRHPGGSAAIKSLCGVDGTAAYNGQHGGSGRPASELANLKVGVLIR